MAVKGVKKKNITSVNDMDQLQIKCQQLQPGVVFINEDCFIQLDYYIKIDKAGDS